jgi:hypothetical protein
MRDRRTSIIVVTKKCVKLAQTVSCANKLWEATLSPIARLRNSAAIGVGRRLPTGRSAIGVRDAFQLSERPQPSLKLLCIATKQNVECVRARSPVRRVPAASQDLRSRALLTEQEVARSWSRIFNSGTIEPASFDRAEQLLDELRAESPLRHRLTKELEELRSIHSRRAKVPARA